MDARVISTDPAEAAIPFADLFRPGDYRWAIYDRPTRTIYIGGPDVHMHMTVAENAGVLRNPSSYYRPGANVLGGYVCRSKDGDFYYDPYSGTFPGTNEGVADAENALREVCVKASLKFLPYEKIAPRAKAVSKYL
jgi:hypothetical protein